ncbi:MAG: flagellar hook-length control protein FliK [Desulfobacter sp.]|nr:MAG: flagellar hook-length control protein FliK [Desulfobacter sp.]
MDMMFAFADMKSAVSNLAARNASNLGNPSAGTGSAGRAVEDTGSNLDAFAARFKKAVGKLEAVEQSSQGAGKAEKLVETGENTETTTSAVKSGKAFLASLEAALLKISGGDLNGVTMDREGLDALEKLLVKAGFDPDEVAEALAGFKEKLGAGEKEISLGDVMKSLDSLEPVDGEDADEDVFLETSSLPFIAALLEEYQIPKDVAAGILEKADSGQNGINLNTLVQALEKMMESGSQSGTPLEITADRSKVTELLASVNMASAAEAVVQDIGAGASEGETVTLKDLISIFDTYARSKTKDVQSIQHASQLPLAGGAGENGGKESAGALVDKLFASFTLASEDQDLSGFSFREVRDQFKNDLLIPKKNGKNKTSLFAAEQTGDTSRTDTGLKEISTPVAKQVASGLSGQGHGRHAAGTEHKSADAQADKVDVQSGDTAGAKADTNSPLTSLRTKSSERALPSYVTNQVNRSIVRAVNNGESTLKIQLKPAELGRLMLTIDNSGNSIKVSILTENQAAKDILASNVNELRTTLASAGISLDSFDVDMSSDFRQSMANAGGQAGNFNRKGGRNAGGGLGGSNAEGSDEPLPLAQESDLDGSYHFVA